MKKYALLIWLLVLAAQERRGTVPLAVAAEVAAAVFMKPTACDSRMEHRFL